MIVVCPKCSSRLQPSGDKPLVHPFTVRCPKCNNTVHSEAPSPASAQGALAMGNSPATAHQRYQPGEPAPPFEAGAGNAAPGQDAVEELGRLLGSLFGQSANGNVASGMRPSWSQRKVLICVADARRQNLAMVLTKQNYQVFVAQDTRQGIERMRENRMDVVLLDQEFDETEQGVAFIMREVNILRPAQRRRLFFMLMSPVLRTLETHAAFLNNVNAIVNSKDIDDLPRVLEHALRDYNELYKEFNVALNVSAI